MRGSSSSRGQESNYHKFRTKFDTKIEKASKKISHVSRLYLEIQGGVCSAIPTCGDDYVPKLPQRCTVEGS